ncbi:MAG: sulfite exporter TauE/SafE family protein [Candidatus Berkelbacteria bacterium]
MNYWIIFFTGLTTGGLSCLALQGGLLTSTMVESQTKSARIRSIILFLISKLTAYTILGLILGFLGEVFTLSPKVLGGLNIFIALFMLGVALETLKVHPIFKFFLLQPPKFLRRLIFKQENEKSSFTAIILGIFTVLIPCGVTQAMMALAVSTGRPLVGATTMFFFILGTIPVFFILAYFASEIGEKFKNIFYKIVAVFLIILSIYTFNHGLRLSGINLSTPKNSISRNSVIDDNTQKVTIKLDNKIGYTPNSIILKKDVPVELSVYANSATTCVRVFVIPSLKVNKVVPEKEPLIIKFTPTKLGKIPFTCSMGMYQGEFVVE